MIRVEILEKILHIVPIFFLFSYYCNSYCTKTINKIIEPEKEYYLLATWILSLLDYPFTWSNNLNKNNTISYVQSSIKCTVPSRRNLLYFTVVSIISCCEMPRFPKSCILSGGKQSLTSSMINSSRTPVPALKV